MTWTPVLIPSVERPETLVRVWVLFAEPEVDHRGLWIVVLTVRAADGAPVEEPFYQIGRTEPVYTLRDVRHREGRVRVFASHYEKLRALPGYRDGMVILVDDRHVEWSPSL